MTNAHLDPRQHGRAELVLLPGELTQPRDEAEKIFLWLVDHLPPTTLELLAAILRDSIGGDCP